MALWEPSTVNMKWGWGRWVRFSARRAGRGVEDPEIQGCPGPRCVLWRVCTGSQEGETACEMASRQTGPHLPWFHCHQREPAPFPKAPAQRWKEEVGAGFVWLHLWGSDLTSGEGAQRRGAWLWLTHRSSSTG